MAQFAKPEPKCGDGSIVVNKDFGITGNRFDLQFLTQAVLGGKIQQETYWSERQRRGTLSDSFDPEVEARIAGEAPDLSPGIPPGKGMDLNQGSRRYRLMATTHRNETLVDLYIERAIDLLRLEAGTRNKVLALLNDLEGELVAHWPRSTRPALAACRRSKSG
jgi:hypothetical protein